MVNMLDTIIAKSNQLNSDDLIGSSLTIKITKLVGSAGDQPIAVHYENDNGKPYMPCKSMRRVMVALWGLDGSLYAGRSLTLYRDEKVAFGGLAVGGLRISHMSHIDNAHTIVLTASRANKKPFTVKPLLLAVEAPTVDMTALRDAGVMAANQGLDALKAWWKDQGSTKQKLLGTEYLADAKALAEIADNAPPSLEDEVASTCANLSMGEIIESEILQDLKKRVEASGKENLINDLFQYLPPMEL